MWGCYNTKRCWQLLIFGRRLSKVHNSQKASALEADRSSFPYVTPTKYAPALTTELSPMKSRWQHRKTVEVKCKVACVESGGG